MEAEEQTLHVAELQLGLFIGCVLSILLLWRQGHELLEALGDKEMQNHSMKGYLTTKRGKLSKFLRDVRNSSYSFTSSFSKSILRLTSSLSMSPQYGLISANNLSTCKAENRVYFPAFYKCLAPPKKQPNKQVFKENVPLYKYKTHIRA